METIELGSVVLDVTALCDGTIEREIPVPIPLGSDEYFDSAYFAYVASRYPLVTDANENAIRELLILLEDSYAWLSWIGEEPPDMSPLQMSAALWYWVFEDRNSCDFEGGKWSYRFAVQEVKS